MPYPLLDPALLSKLRLGHALFNSTVLLCFFYHGTLGLTIRRARNQQAALPLRQLKRHRKLGPVLTILGLLGFTVGSTITLLRTSRILEYPPHLFTGVAIVALLIATFWISRKITGRNPAYRDLHFALGIAILGLYLLQAFLGVGLLF